MILICLSSPAVFRTNTLFPCHGRIITADLAMEVYNTWWTLSVSIPILNGTSQWLVQELPKSIFFNERWETLLINNKGIVHFEINFWYVLAYLKGIQDVNVFVSTVFSILIFLGQTILVYHTYNAGLWSPPQRACTAKSKLNMIYWLVNVSTRWWVCVCVRKRTVFILFLPLVTTATSKWWP